MIVEHLHEGMYFYECIGFKVVRILLKLHFNAAVVSMFDFCKGSIHKSAKFYKVSSTFADGCMFINIELDFSGGCDKYSCHSTGLFSKILPVNVIFTSLILPFCFTFKAPRFSNLLTCLEAVLSEICKFEAS